MGKIDPTEARALAWAKAKIRELDTKAAHGDVHAEVEAHFLKSEVDKARRDLHFDGSGGVGKLKDTFGAMAHHPLAALLGAGVAAVTLAVPEVRALVELLPGTVPAALTTGALASGLGTGVDWG